MKNPNVNVSVILVAGGYGKRFGRAKQFSLLRGKTVLDWSLEKFNRHESITQIVLVLPKGFQDQKIKNTYSKIQEITEGGETRQESVASGFKCLALKPKDVVLVHDAARPLFSMGLVDRIISAVIKTGAAVPLIPVEDTVKEMKGSWVLRTVERTNLFLAQTPQGFLFHLLQKTLKEASDKNWKATDEAALVELIQEQVTGVPGEKSNIKITNPIDLRIAEALIED
jgi:2-C-methyl-D-erythritol 4-phosphate cytidylyltransferase